MKEAYEILKGRDHLLVSGANGRVTLKWLLKEQCERLLTRFTWLRIGTSVGLL